MLGLRRFNCANTAYGVQRPRLGNKLKVTVAVPCSLALPCSDLFTVSTSAARQPVGTSFLPSVEGNSHLTSSSSPSSLRGQCLVRQRLMRFSFLLISPKKRKKRQKEPKTAMNNECIPFEMKI